MMMFWSALLVALSVLGAGNSMTNSVYKVILNQRGFAQFLQYDIEIPPLREFTICTWFRVQDFTSDQSIFTYVDDAPREKKNIHANSDEAYVHGISQTISTMMIDQLSPLQYYVKGNKKVMRLWLDTGGRALRLVVQEAQASVPVDLRRDWVHLCFSYQADYGAWALYVDSHIVACEAVQSLYGYVIPGGGSIIIGYGTGEEGQQNGLEGEIFGTNMILVSTIENNYTLKGNPNYKQKPLRQNTVKYSNHIQYIVLKDLQLPQQINDPASLESKGFPPFLNTQSKSLDFEFDAKSRKVKQAVTSDENKLIDYLASSRLANPSSNKNKIIYWQNVNAGSNAKKTNDNKKNIKEQSGSGTSYLPTAFATSTVRAKPLEPDSSEKMLRMEWPPITESVYNTERFSSSLTNSPKNELSEYETPPPPQTNEKVYGQWISSKYAGNVLNYLKSINFRNNPKRIPPTIQLPKTTDEYPYATDLKISVVKPPLQLKRKNLIIEKRFHSHSMNPFIRVHVQKREINQPQINVKIIDSDVRPDILKTHAQTHPKHVIVTPRGETKVDLHQKSKTFEDLNSEETTVTKSKTFNTASDILNHKLWNNFGLSVGSNLLSSLPFLKSVEYFTEESDDRMENGKVTNSEDMYTKSFSKYKWHNIPSLEQTDSKGDRESSDAYSNTKKKVVPVITYNDSHEIFQKNNAVIKKGRELALTVSNQSNLDNDISILKYNHGYLPVNNKERDSVNRSVKSNFDKPVKIGNALNEKHAIGINDQQKRQSFVGGDERVPDIQRYRSDLEEGGDAGAGEVPGSLRPRICSTADSYQHYNVFYIQPDESVDINYIDSPIKPQNLGIEFIQQNYKSCSLEDSTFGKSSLLLLNWSRTPVRLFGGAMPQKTTDLCGFFRK